MEAIFTSYQHGRFLKSERGGKRAIENLDEPIGEKLLRRTSRPHRTEAKKQEGNAWMMEQRKENILIKRGVEKKPGAKFLKRKEKRKNRVDYCKAPHPDYGRGVKEKSSYTDEEGKKLSGQKVKEAITC